MNAANRHHWPFAISAAGCGLLLAAVAAAGGAAPLTFIALGSCVTTVGLAPWVLHNGQNRIGTTMVAGALFGLVLMASHCALHYGAQYVPFALIVTLVCAVVLGLAGIVLALAIAVIESPVRRMFFPTMRGDHWDSLLDSEPQNRPRFTSVNAAYVTLLVAIGLAVGRALPAPDFNKLEGGHRSDPSVDAQTP